MKMTVFWVVAPCSLVEIERHFRDAPYLHHQGLMMNAVSISETSVNFCDITRRILPEDGHLQDNRNTLLLKTIEGKDKERTISEHIKRGQANNKIKLGKCL
jgi:hypothetical protein